MGKKKKLKNLGTQIMVESEKVEVLLEQIILSEDAESKTTVLAGIALEKSKKISCLNERMGKCLGR